MSDQESFEIYDLILLFFVLVLHNICEFIPHDDGYISNRYRGCVQGRDSDKIKKTHWKKTTTLSEN